MVVLARIPNGVTALEVKAARVGGLHVHVRSGGCENLSFVVCHVFLTGVVGKWRLNRFLSIY